jgi:hypothetical protein
MSTLIHMDSVPAADRIEFVQKIAATTGVLMEHHIAYHGDYLAKIRASGPCRATEVRRLTAAQTPPTARLGDLISQFLLQPCSRCHPRRTAALHAL